MSLTTRQESGWREANSRDKRTCCVTVALATTSEWRRNTVQYHTYATQAAVTWPRDTNRLLSTRAVAAAIAATRPEYGIHHHQAANVLRHRHVVIRVRVDGQRTAPHTRHAKCCRVSPATRIGPSLPVSLPQSDLLVGQRWQPASASCASHAAFWASCFANVCARWLQSVRHAASRS